MKKKKKKKKNMVEIYIYINIIIIKNPKIIPYPKGLGFDSIRIPFNADIFNNYWLEFLVCYFNTNFSYVSNKIFYFGIKSIK